MTPRPKSRRSPSQSTILPETAATSDGAPASARTSAASQPRPGGVSLLRKATASPEAAATRRLLPAQNPRLAGLASTRSRGEAGGGGDEAGGGDRGALRRSRAPRGASRPSG